MENEPPSPLLTMKVPDDVIIPVLPTAWSVAPMLSASLGRGVGEPGMLSGNRPEPRIQTVAGLSPRARFRLRGGSSSLSALMYNREDYFNLSSVFLLALKNQGVVYAWRQVQLAGGCLFGFIFYLLGGGDRSILTAANSSAVRRPSLCSSIMRRS